MSNITPLTPSYTFGYWRPWKDNSNIFDSYLDYAKDISLSKYGADTVGQYINQASKEQVLAINHLGQEIGRGMNILSNQMSDVNDKLCFLNRNMDIQIEQQKLSNLLLQNIAELLRVPDSEKERQHSIELGVKFFVNAAKDSDLYSDALEELLKAESLMKQDYFVLHRIGCIYLYVEKFLNPEMAIGYFSRAAKYASVESDPGAARLANALTNNFNTVNSDMNNSEEQIGLLAADSYEKAAFSSYVIGNFEDAVNYQAKALKLNPNSQNRFLLAKYHTRNKNIEETIKNLDIAIDENPHLALGAFKDIDLINEPEVQSLIEYKNNLINKKINCLIEKANSLNHFEAKNIIKTLDSLLSNSYELKILQYAKIKIPILLLEEELIKKNKAQENEQNKKNNKLTKYIEILKANENIFENYNELLSLLTNQIQNSSDLTAKSSDIYREIDLIIDINRVVNEHIALVNSNSKYFKNSDEIKNKLLAINNIPISLRENELIILTDHISQIINKNQVRNRSSVVSNSSNDKRCYIATATFGSADHYIIDDLRQFRDQCLAHNNIGRKFILLYYKISPPISKIIANNKCLKLVSLYLLIMPLHFIILKLITTKR
jgi:hypothetical protein